MELYMSPWHIENIYLVNNRTIEPPAHIKLSLQAFGVALSILPH